MTIITFLGLIGGAYSDERGVSLWQNYKGADYTLSPELAESFGKNDGLKTNMYQNMLPLLLDNFPNAELIAVGTVVSVAVQKTLSEKQDCYAFPNEKQLIILDSENDFEEIFRTLNDLLEKHDDLIVDISHSFRHLPILMLVNMIIENIDDPDKIKHILFAKELKKDTQYEIIDLRSYLDLADISYALSSFNENYTITSIIHPQNKNYGALLKMLRQFSEHILANSFERLLGTHHKDDEPLVQHIIDKLDLVQRHPVAKPLERYIRRIRNHMMELKMLRDEPLDEQYYAIAKMLFSKGYLLNTVTLLDEALGRYCFEGIKQLDPSICESIEKFENKIERKEGKSSLYNRYIPGNQSKNLIKFKECFNGQFLDSVGLKEKVIKKFMPMELNTLKEFIISCDNLRNDLAHGNSNKSYRDIKLEIEKMLQKYRKICVENDPLGRFV